MASRAGTAVSAASGSKPKPPKPRQAARLTVATNSYYLGDQLDAIVERILRYADREIAALPEAVQEITLGEIMRELTTWLEAIGAGH